MKKSILALSLLVGLSTAASSYAALPETVRIGTDTTYAPFSSKDAKGDFVGFDIDLGNEMCKRMQVKCTWVASDFDALIPSLKAKKSTLLFRRFPLPINVSRRLPSPTSCTPQILV
ncbi:putative lysine/arginine/ornithine ABC transporter, periplasmic lysine/arginine/ornithine-binding protein ArgT [Escherichia coli 3.2303]|nr:putative lysine/arginine/ornithine ABC transporter, periplasmic lysine/arginine/ornithine-binding protein ArgT [Escherichia coli 3.2303]CDK78303.1 Lysine-arginine-ornithine-binding periplasmic protein precursor (TC 3.A.1.3.1) [Klebsiella pneumoniae IS22]